MAINLWKNFKQIVTLQGVVAKDGRKLNASDLSIIPDGAVIFSDEKILWVGSSANVPSAFEITSTQTFSEHVLLPEIIDSHTHLVFGGDRSHEYAQRLNGVDYQEIAKQGGGINHTVSETNQLSNEDLFDLADRRVQKMSEYGIGTLEIKTGYSLNIEGEIRLCKIIQQLKNKYSPRLRIFCTLMAAHAIPHQYSDSSSYIDKVALPVLELMAHASLIDFVDIFHERGYFNDHDLKKIAAMSSALGIPLKMHADEFNDNCGAFLAAQLHAISADHLLKISSAGMQSLAQSKTVATLLPGTGLFLGKGLANARALLDAGAKVALASDFNPGSCHYDNLVMLASMAAPSYKMNLAELWAGITYNAAAALGLSTSGAITVGFLPRFSMFKINSFEHITYEWGKNYFVQDVRY
ncbi:MAG: imidazolonepropionase [Bdellovibrionales bacterium GWA2_49_15]|nr:MAG: imidazolonepropionase [Bdellovibrionales bacterium GWA2_49_15]